MEKEVIINTGNNDGFVTILEGQALPMKPYPEITVKGILAAPGAFLSARKEILDPNHCYLTVDRDNGTLAFIMYTPDNDVDEIIGKLEPSKAVKDFGINSEKLYSSKELAKFFRKNAFYFSDKDHHLAIIKALMNFEAKVTTVIEDKSDGRGNAKKLLEKAVDTEIPEGFMMKAPIFSGYDPVEFEVLIGAEASNTDVRFFLESPELFLLSDQEKGKLIEDEVKAFEEFSCAILYES